VVAYEVGRDAAAVGGLLCGVDVAASSYAAAPLVRDWWNRTAAEIDTRRYDPVTSNCQHFARRGMEAYMDLASRDRRPPLPDLQDVSVVLRESWVYPVVWLLVWSWSAALERGPGAVVPFQVLAAVSFLVLGRLVSVAARRCRCWAASASVLGCQRLRSSLSPLSSMSVLDLLRLGISLSLVDAAYQLLRKLGRQSQGAATTLSSVK